MKNTNLKISNLFSIKKKVCVITGGSGGIGSTISNHIYNNGGVPIIIDKVFPKNNIKKKVQFYKCDMSNSNECVLILNKIKKNTKK